MTWAPSDSPLPLTPRHLSPLRCLLVWLGATGTALSTWWAVLDTARPLAHPAIWQGSFENLVVGLAAGSLLGCTGWLWLVTTVTATQAARGRLPSTPVGLIRRLVLMGCGAVVLVGVGTPAMAGGGQGGQILAGLPMPDRASASAPRAPSPSPSSSPSTPTVRPNRPSTREVVVRTGDSLWSIAARSLAPDAELHEIDAAWRALYAANREVIGADPALIRPDQRLRPAPGSFSDN